MEPEQVLLDEGGQVEPDRAHVAQDLVGRAAILDDAQAARRHHVDDAMIEHHEVDCQKLAGNQIVQVEAQRGDVLREVGDRLLESHEHARFAVEQRTVDQELEAQQSLAATGSAAHQGGSSLWQAASGELIQPLNAGARLRNLMTE